MKKLFAVLMAAAMLMSCAAVAETATEAPATDEAATETETTETAAPEIDWTSVTAAPADTDVETVMDDLGVSLMLPSDWVELELSDEEAAAGYTHCFGTEDNSRLLYVAIEEQSEATSLEELYAQLVDEGYTPAGEDFNGMHFLVYNIDETEVIAMTMVDDTHVLYMDAIAPESDEEMGTLFHNIHCSVSFAAIDGDAEIVEGETEAEPETTEAAAN